MDKLEIGTGLAIAGVAVFSIHGVYTQHAGSLSDARTAPPGDSATHERLRDADILTGGLVLLVGGSLAVMTKAPHPFLLAVLAFGVIALYYHATLSSQSVTVSEPTEGDK